MPTAPPLLPPDVQSLRGVTFRPRRRVAGQYAGAHASRQRGRSVTFSDYRPYTPGDPPTDIDWKVYGRSDRLVVKRYEQPTDLTVQLVLDASASMSFAGLDSKQPTTDQATEKFTAAAQLAAAIAWLVTRQQDRVGLALSTPQPPAPLRPGTSSPHFQQLEAMLRDAQPRGQASMADAVATLAPALPHRSLWVLISDLMEPVEPLARALAGISAHGGEAILFQTLHHDELDLPTLSNATLVDSETGHRLRISPAQYKADYQRRLHQYTQRWRRVALNLGFDHRVVRSDTPAVEALRDYLVQRSERYA